MHWHAHGTHAVPLRVVVVVRRLYALRLELRMAHVHFHCPLPLVPARVLLPQPGSKLPVVDLPCGVVVSGASSSAKWSEDRQTLTKRGERASGT